MKEQKSIKLESKSLVSQLFVKDASFEVVRAKIENATNVTLTRGKADAKRVLGIKGLEALSNNSTEVLSDALTLGVVTQSMADKLNQTNLI